MGFMTEQEALKKKIMADVRSYWELAFNSPQTEFIPGESKINYGGRFFDADEMSNLVEASLEFWLTAGHWSREFEKSLAEHLNIRYALLVNSGSSANLLAFMALTSPLLEERRITRDSEIITVAAGFPTTVAPIIQYGAVPVFVDVDLTTVNIDCSQLEAARSEKTKAVMLAHTLGSPFNLTRIKEFCEHHSLWLIEDNCDSLGSKYQGQYTGTFGDIGTSSFYPPHHITMGEGGAVYTNNPLLNKIMTSMRDWGRDCWCASGRDDSCGCRFTGQFGSLPYGYDHKYVYSHFGYNLKATDMQAAIGCAQLEKLSVFTAARINNYNYLKNGLESGGATDCLSIQQADEDAAPSWFGFMMILKPDAGFSRNELSEHLEKNKIQTRNLFAGNLTRHPCFADLRMGRDYRIPAPLTNTDYIMNSALWIGVYPGMTYDKLDYMISVINEFVQAAK